MHYIITENYENETTFKVDEHSTIVLLPYYYETHIRVGSDAQMATAVTLMLEHSGIYSVYFVVIGRNWYSKRRWNTLWLFRKPDFSQARSAHDEIVIGMREGNDLSNADLASANLLDTRLENIITKKIDSLTMVSTDKPVTQLHRITRYTSDGKPIEYY